MLATSRTHAAIARHGLKLAATSAHESDIAIREPVPPSSHCLRDETRMTPTILPRFCLALTLALSANASADCNLAFAPDEIRQRVRQHHHHASSTRDVPPRALTPIVAPARAKPDRTAPASEAPVSSERRNASDALGSATHTRPVDH